MRQTCRTCDGSGQIPDTRDPFERNAPRIDCKACGGIGEIEVTDDANGRPVFTAGCGHVVSVLVGIGTGYARMADGSSLCYPCADEHERQAMRDAAATPGAAFLAYVSSDGKSLTTWPGGILANVTGHTVARTGWNRSQVHRWWAVSPDGAHWYGSNAGEGMCIAVRRIKGTR
jgi:hypothetical protein